MTTEGFKKLFLPMHKKLFGVAFALTGNVSDAEDILQETYIRLWNRRNELAGIKNHEAYCVTLVRNLGIDCIRTRRKHLETVESNLVAVDESPETKSIGKDELKLVKSLIDRLPSNQQQVIRLHGIENMTMEEIETITGFSAVNVRVLLSRARKFIKEQYIQLSRI